MRGKALLSFGFCSVLLKKVCFQCFLPQSLPNITGLKAGARGNFTIVIQLTPVPGILLCTTVPQERRAKNKQRFILGGGWEEAILYFVPHQAACFCA